MYLTFNNNRAILKMQAFSFSCNSCFLFKSMLRSCSTNNGKIFAGQSLVLMEQITTFKRLVKFPVKSETQREPDKTWFTIILNYTLGYQNDCINKAICDIYNIRFLFYADKQNGNSLGILQNESYLHFLEKLQKQFSLFLGKY